jgi:phosphoserine aminotransferase
MSRVHNFSAGPAALPEAVLAQAQAEMLDWEGAGMSVMEMSHRGREFGQIIHEAEADLRTLLAVPANYRVLFLQGGASLHFSAIPLNLMSRGEAPDYVVTGEWSSKALREARRYGPVSVAAETPATAHTRIPPQSGWTLNPRAAYLHYCSNETVHGVEFHWVPESGNVPLVADMSSHLLSGPIDVSRFGLIYAGAQKNIGPAGLVIVIVREDLLGGAMPACPGLLDYALQARAGSMPNTPATFSIYMAGLVFKWLLAQGGLSAIDQINEAKARLLYGAIDSSSLYTNPVAVADRSRMNVPFLLRRPELDEAFLAGAEARGLVQLRGYRTVGGMRASIYNAMPIEGVQALVDYMRAFEAEHG